MKTRKPVALSTKLDRKLAGYVTAARSEANTGRHLIAAVGAVGLAVVPSLANAEIVYTPANQSIGSENGVSYLPIDLNNDGIVDVTLSAYNFTSFSSGFHGVAFLGVEAQQDNGIAATSQGLVAAGLPGQVIGVPVARTRFDQDGAMAWSRNESNGFSSFRSHGGLWLDATNRYLGVKFVIDGETHYGWARLSAGAGGATLTGYAYETIPDRPIPAGVFETAPPETNSGDNLENPQQTKQRPLTLGELAHGVRRKGSTGCRV